MILKTKLFKPRLNEHFISRPELLDRINKGIKKPLTLVSAPSGYGKSLLVSGFLDQCTIPFAWISLSDNENNRDVFIQYLIAAIRSIYPTFGDELYSLTRSSSSISYSIIRDHMINDLVEIEDDFILVLDDFHLIHNKEIINLISDILVHPPPSFHLIIMTRRDPPLAIAKFRIKDLMQEIRINDLKFKEKETKELLELKLHQEIPSELIKKASQLLDGWVAGLNLLLLNTNSVNSLKSQLETKLVETFLIQELVEQLIRSLSPDVQQCILVSVLFDEFCADLLAEVSTEINVKFDKNILMNR